MFAPDDTRKSLLHEAQTGDPRAWQRLTELYRPLLADWARRHAPAPHDAEDLTQEILLALVRYLPRFEHNGRRGAFRCWLRTLAVHCTQDFWSSRRAQPWGSGDSAVAALLEGLIDENSELAHTWDREHDQFVLRRLFEEAAVEFETHTMQAFRRLALDGVPASLVAQELNMTVGAVYTAKSRILQRLRQLSEGLLDWSGVA